MTPTAEPTVKKLTEQEIINIITQLPFEVANEVLRTEFAKPENIDMFAWFCFGDTHAVSVTPEFHRELWAMAQLPGYKAVAAPRGHAKSTAMNLIYPAWIIANRYERFIIIISDTFTQALEHTENLKDAITTSQNYKRLYGEMENVSHWSKGDMETLTGVRILARASGQKIRGLRYRQWRPGLIIVDDVENDESVASLDQRVKLKHWFLASVLPSLRKDGSIIVVGTILHHDSLLSKMVHNRQEFSGWRVKIYQSISYVDGQAVSLWPKMFTVEDLLARRDDPKNPHYIGSIIFAQEYQNEPFSEDDAIIKPSWIKWTQQLPPEIKRKIVVIDPAISKSEKADFTAKATMVLGSDNNVYITRIGNDRMSFDENLVDIKKWFTEERPVAIGIESVTFQKAFAQSLIGLPIVELMPDTDKVRRTISVSRFFESGQVYIFQGIKNAQALFDQLIEFPSSAHDDMVDVIVYGLQMLLGQAIGSYDKEFRDNVMRKAADRETKTETIFGNIMSKNF